MRTKQFPVLGLILAVLFGTRTANRSDQPAYKNPAPGKVEQRYSPKSKNSPRPPKNVSSQSENNCLDSAAASEPGKLHWSLSQRSSQGCSVSLSPLWKEICKINPVRPADEELLVDHLTEEVFIARCLGPSRPVTSMMAAVPNPQRTHLGLMTDRAIEAIQVAAAEAHFLPLSHYLPWPSPSSGAEPASPESDNDSGSPNPGVLIFHDSERQKYLLVFLVPELPTEGLDAQVFLNARVIMGKVSPGIRDIWFAGPNFSGSVSSLKTLDSELPKNECIHAVSGSVTNPQNDPTPKPGCPAMLTVMETDDGDALCKFIRGAEAFGYKRREIAILSEEGTQYGRQDSERCKSRGTAPLWFLHFPRELSKLRNAYGAETDKSAPPESPAEPGLGLRWQDSNTAQRDDLQTYGGRQTPLSQETVLSSLSLTLRAQGIKALGVLATDPMDEAFLIHSLKKSSPDVRLFLRDPDLLYLRTPDVASLTGTLLVSNYPLIPQNQFWSSSKGQRERLITFPSSFQEGEYNAFVHLLEDAGLSPANEPDMKRLEWDWPAGSAATLDASKSEFQHPLWLAIIGTAGHYPVKLLNYEEVDKASLKLHSLDLGPPQLLPMAFWASIAMLGLLHVFGLRFRGAVPSYFKHDFDLSDRTNVVTLVRLFGHMMAILTIALAQMILGSSYLFFYGSGPGYTTLAGAVAGVTVLLVWTACMQLRTLYILYRQQELVAPPDDRSKIISPKRIFRTAIAGGVIMIGAGVSWGGMTVGARFDNAFLHFRDLSLSSGVAPTLPLASVLLVLYFGIWAYLRRLSYWQHRYVEMFRLKLDPVIQQNLGEDVKAIDTCLLGPLENGRWMIAFWLALGISILAFRPWTTLDMIEPSRVSRFVLFFFGLSLLTLWLNWFRFINIWAHLRNILEHLENLPIRTAFQRLPREKSLPILHWSSSQNTFLLRQVLDRLRALAHADPSTENIALQTQFESRLDALMTHGVVKIQIVERRVVGGSPRPTPALPSRRREDHLREARQEMKELTETLGTRLLQEYWKRGSTGTKQDLEPLPADLKYQLAEDIVALPFYAYIRKVVSELRNILFFLGVAVSLLFTALHTYAFRADQAIDWWFFGLFGCMGGGIFVVVAQMERNALLSRLSDRPPGELGANFYVQLLKYGTVPILTIFGSQVPSISNLVLKWVQPALEALH